MTLAALVAAGAWARAEFSHPPDPLAPTHIRDWRRYSAEGPSTGDYQAPVVLVVFSDYECPFCRKLAGDLRELANKEPGVFRVVYRHFPLSIHSNALAAARSAVCADRQGAFAPYNHELFAEQGSIGNKRWVDFARDVHVPDIDLFSRCLTDPRSAAVLVRDSIAGASLGIQGTPTILINDLELGGYPGKVALDKYIKAASNATTLR